MMKTRAGFTLVEVMISLLIFAMLAGAGAAVLSATIDNRFAIKAASDRVGDLQRMRAPRRRRRGPMGVPLRADIAELHRLRQRAAAELGRTHDHAV